MGKENWVFIVKHPVDALKTIFLRAETRILDDVAPTNYTEITLTAAIKGIQKNRRPRVKIPETIQLSDWSGTAQDDMNKGKVIHPDGRSPKHPIKDF